MWQILFFSIFHITSTPTYSHPLRAPSKAYSTKNIFFISDQQCWGLDYYVFTISDDINFWKTWAGIHNSSTHWFIFHYRMCVLKLILCKILRNIIFNTRWSVGDGRGGVQSFTAASSLFILSDRHRTAFCDIIIQTMIDRGQAQYVIHTSIIECTGCSCLYNFGNVSIVAKGMKHWGWKNKMSYCNDIQGVATTQTTA